MYLKERTLKKNNQQQFEATDLGNAERFIAEHKGTYYRSQVQTNG